MMTWKVDYKGHEIRVTNSWGSGEELWIDGELQDVRRGQAVRSRLSGRIRGGEGEGEPVKVSIGGWFKVHCAIFVDHTCVLNV